MRRVTDDLSMYSDISIRIISLSDPKYVAASALHSSVLPVPVGLKTQRLDILPLEPNMDRLSASRTSFLTHKRGD